MTDEQTMAIIKAARWQRWEDEMYAVEIIVDVLDVQRATTDLLRIGADPAETGDAVSQCYCGMPAVYKGSCAVCSPVEMFCEDCPDRGQCEFKCRRPADVTPDPEPEVL
jgi:hypothetical protein